MSAELVGVACSAYLFLITLYCWARYLIWHQPRGKHPRRRLHGTPKKYKVRRG
jgi:hypothetical protein